MITGAHSIIYSKNPEADRAFLRDVLQLTNVDVGDGWLIFGLPPAEVAVHPSDENDLHEFYLMCDDIEAFAAEMEKNQIVCEPVQDMGWGLLSQIHLPGGGKLGVYQPRHARPWISEAGRPPDRHRCVPQASLPIANHLLAGSKRRDTLRHPVSSTQPRPPPTAGASSSGCSTLIGRRLVRRRGAPASVSRPG